MSQENQATQELELEELRQTASWKEEFCGKQQDKARFFITLLSTEMFVVGLSLNSKPEQTYLFIPSAISFLVCFASAFWSMYHFARVIEPRYFRGRHEGTPLRSGHTHEELLKRLKHQATLQNENLQHIVDDQAIHLRRGTETFAVFNGVFALALVVSRLSWFLPHTSG